MTESRFSVTAQRAALKRAVHQLLDNPKILDDPLALKIVGKEYAAALRTNPAQFETSPLSSYIRAFIVARSRYAEDELAIGVKQGVRQYVILGAGFDTFAYRNPFPKGILCIFEVDHPATQAVKQARLKEASIEIPSDLIFVPVDFEKQALAEALSWAGYDPKKCTFFSWLGVTEYLTADAVMRTLRFIASAPQGSIVVFDYLLSPSLLTPSQRLYFDALARRMASISEPWQTFFEPESLKKDLQAMGFKHIEDVGPEQINSRYFGNRKDGLRVGTLSHLMKAQI